MAKIRQRRRTVAKGPTEPGRAILPEDQQYRTGRAHLPKKPKRTPAPRVISNERVSRSDVQERLMTAMKTLRAVPDRERRFFVQTSSSPDYVREYIDAYDPDVELHPRFQPTPADISDYLTALAWVRHLDKAAWRILWWRSFEVSFGLIGKHIGRSDETARKRYETAITDAWIAANGVYSLA